MNVFIMVCTYMIVDKINVKTGWTKHAINKSLEPSENTGK